MVYVSGGGEPFLHANIWGILEAIPAAGMEFCLHSNLRELDHEDIERLLNLHPRQVTASLWGIRPETYERTHPGGKVTSHDRIMQNIRHLAETGRTTVKLHVVLTRLNADELPELIAVAQQFGVSGVDIALLDPIPGVTDGLLPDHRQAANLLRVLSDSKRMPVATDPQIVSRLQSIVVGNTGWDRSNHEELVETLFPCYAGWFTARITAEGNVLYCLKGHRCPMGNLHRSRFRDIWVSEAYQRMRRTGANGSWNERESAFGRMGNDPTVQPGCFCGCDDYCVNALLRTRLEGYRAFKRWLMKPWLIERYRKI